jgi:hypothetical protein
MVALDSLYWRNVFGFRTLDVGIQKIQTILLNESYNAIALQSVDL